MTRTKFVTREVIFSLAAVALTFAAISCSSESDANQPPTEAEIETYCRDVARTADALQDVRDAAVPIDEIKMDDARLDLRSSIDYLDTSSREMEGGNDLVVQLKEDLNELLKIIATPDLLSVSAEIQAQIATVQNDVNQLKAAGNCP